MDRLKQINDQIEQLEAEKKRIIAAKTSTYGNPKIDQFLKNYSGKQLLKVHKLEDVRVWDIYGEDPNCDMGGSHHQPYLATVEGSLIKAIEYAVGLTDFYQWGAGGDLKVAKQTKPIKL